MRAYSLGGPITSLRYYGSCSFGCFGNKHFSMTYSSQMDKRHINHEVI